VDERRREIPGEAPERMRASVVASMADALDAFIAAHAGIGDASGPFTHVEGEIGDAAAAATATWELTGYCLNLAEALLVLLRKGYVVQSEVLTRALFEASSILGALAARDSGELRRRWLAQQNIPQAAVNRAKERLVRDVEGHPDLRYPLRSFRHANQRIYKHFSEASHANRAAVRRLSRGDCFIYGAAEEGFERALWTGIVALVVWSVMLEMEIALGRAFGDDWPGEVRAVEARVAFRETIDELLGALRGALDSRDR
jgi:hypothetical protein